MSIPQAGQGLKVSQQQGPNSALLAPHAQHLTVALHGSNNMFMSTNRLETAKSQGAD